MPAFGVDYSYARPSASTLVAEGVTFCCRYLRDGPNRSGKALTAVEARGLIGAGIALVSNDETTGTQLLGGYGGGVRDARAALDAHLAATAPRDRPIYFSPWDHDPAGLNAGQWALLWDYLDGAASVLGRGLVGLYGGYPMIKRAFDRGAITWGWQTYAWSGGQWDPRAHIQQYANGQWGGTVDFDRAVKADFGQWPKEEDPMPLTDADIPVIRKALGLREGEAAASDTDVATLLRGDPTHPDNLKQLRADLAAVCDTLAERIDVLRQDLGTDLAAILTAARQAVDPAAVAALLAGQLEITGIQTDPAGIVTVTFGPRPPA